MLFTSDASVLVSVGTLGFPMIAPQFKRLRNVIVVSIILAVLLPWPHPGRTFDCGSPVWELPHDMLAYFYALHLETTWGRVQPKFKADLERHLHLYSTEQIAPSRSCWARSYSLKPGEYMLQYQILWHAPLDVVYDASGRIHRIATSYE